MEKRITAFKNFEQDVSEYTDEVLKLSGKCCQGGIKYFFMALTNCNESQSRFLLACLVAMSTQIELSRETFDKIRLECEVGSEHLYLEFVENVKKTLREKTKEDLLNSTTEAKG